MTKLEREIAEGFERRREIAMRRFRRMSDPQPETGSELLRRAAANSHDHSLSNTRPDQCRALYEQIRINEQLQICAQAEMLRRMDGRNGSPFSLFGGLF